VNRIVIKQAQENEIPVIEAILLDAVNWLNDLDQPLWGADEVIWDSLSRSYKVDDFYIAYIDATPSGCMALVDYDPLFWPNVKKGESLFVHKLAVIESARKTGVADALINFYKEQGLKRGVKDLRLDTHALRPKLRAFYEKHGFALVEERSLGKFHVAFYVYTFPKSTRGDNH
jgi:GNAT superfamily N-acetyltransferase